MFPGFFCTCIERAEVGNIMVNAAIGTKQKGTTLDYADRERNITEKTISRRSNN